MQKYLTYFLCLLFAIVGTFLFLASKPLGADVIEKSSIVRSIEKYSVSNILNIQKKRDQEYEQIYCLAENIYFEARGESTLGQMAVGFVTLNRVASEMYPNTVCEVVNQGQISNWHQENTGKRVPLMHKCQFSWKCDGRADIISDRKAFSDILELAKTLMTTKINDVTHGALFYHADYVKPRWASSKHRTVKIGRHIFYRKYAQSNK